MTVKQFMLLGVALVLLTWPHWHHLEAVAESLLEARVAALEQDSHIHGVVPPPGPTGPTGSTGIPGPTGPTGQPPVPPGDYATGPLVESGFWRGWRVDSRRNFTDHGTYGSMSRNAAGVRWFGPDEDRAGSVSFMVRFTDPSQLNRAGGKHLGGVASNPLAKRPRDENGQRYPKETTRIDLGRPADERVRVHLYNVVDGPLREKTGWVDVPFAPLGTWTGVTIRWRQRGDVLELFVNENGEEPTFKWPLLPGSPPLGAYAYVGNMDDIEGRIEFNSFRFEQ